MAIKKIFIQRKEREDRARLPEKTAPPSSTSAAMGYDGELSAVFYYMESQLHKKQKEAAAAAAAITAAVITAAATTAPLSAEKNFVAIAKKTAKTSSPFSDWHHRSTFSAPQRVVISPAPSAGHDGDESNETVEETTTASIITLNKRLFSVMYDSEVQEPPKKVFKYRLCSVDGCSKRAQNKFHNSPNWRSLCASHGAKLKRCSHKGCENNSVNRGVCKKHGAERKLCKHEGCPNAVQNRGLCIKHGAKVKICSIDGCPNQAKLRGMCRRHARRCDDVDEQLRHAVLLAGLCENPSAAAKEISAIRSATLGYR
jgi:hypothetical protein